MDTRQKSDDSPDEQQLIRNVLAGKHNQFEELMLRNQTMIFAMIKRQVRDEATAKDLSQETFLRAYKGLKGFKFRSSFSTWLTRIALNVTHSYFASRRYKEQQKQVALEAEHLENVSPDESPEQDNRYAISILQNCIGNLKPKYREVIVLCSLEGKTYNEAAEILQVPVGTVCSRMNTALTQLRKTFVQQKAQGVL